MNRTQGNPTQGLTGATIGFFVGFAAVALFGPTANRFKDLMGLTPLMVGFLVAIPSLSGSLLRIPFAAWVDASGGRKPFLVLLALSSVGMVGLALVIFLLYPDRLTAGLYPLLLLLGVLCGCGIATFSVGVGQVSYWFPQAQQGGALGAYAGIGNLAPGLFSLLLPLALGAFGLQVSYLLWLVFLLAGFGLYALFGKNAPYFQLLQQGQAPARAKELAQKAGQVIFPSGSLKDSLVRSARIPQTWALVGIYFTTFGGFIALTAWLPTYWSAAHRMTTVQAGVLTAGFSITASLVRILGGKLADRWGGEMTAILALLVLAAGAFWMAFAGLPALAVPAEFLMAVGMGLGNGAVFKLVPQAAPGAVGGASGWVGGLGAFGGFVLPPLLGAAGFSAGFLIFTALALLSLGLAYWLRRSISLLAARSRATS